MKKRGKDMRDHNWFELNGWNYDIRDHMWKKVKGEKERIHETLEMKGSKKANLGMKVIKSISKPFTKINNLSIFNNQQFPLKFHEVMFKD